MGDIFAMVSRSDGDTWEEPRQRFSITIKSKAIFSSPTLTPFFSNRRIIMSFGVSPCVAPSSRRTARNRIWWPHFSADGGWSWTPVELSMHYTGPSGRQCVGRRNGGSMAKSASLLPAHRNTLGSRSRQRQSHPITLFSAAAACWNGSWKAYIPQPTGGQEVFLHEGNIAPWGDPGGLPIVMRTANYDETSEPHQRSSSALTRA